ncbi:MAG: V-type ATP synthase subunit E [Oscillospiraceae bacterium]|nr:V-type ATP synthase subunit E [Oscillospiraceae bacterium]MDE7170707.1 V-type ATP synthase subunit E [Oscillospiraceae bacterium]
MNGIEKITARIAEDGKAENDALLAQARAQAAEVTAKYQAEARAAADEILAQGRKNAEARARHLDSTAQMECRKAVLAAKQDVIEEAFQAAHKKLLNLPQAEYVTFLAGLAAKASVTGKEKLIFSANDRAQVGKDVVAAANKKLAAGKLTLAEETRPMDGGFILSDGAVEVNCTFDTLIRLQRGALAGEVAKALFD